MSPSTKITRTASAVLVLAGVSAVAAAFAIGLTGWPPTKAHAESSPTALGVSEASAVQLPAATDASEKFQGATLATAAALTGATRGTLGKSDTNSLAKTSTKRRAKKPSTQLGGKGWNVARVSWYGPGFYGNTMAGGGTLTHSSMVVAHRSLPFGTKVRIVYNGRSVTAVVRDRGPYVAGRTFDLGPGTAKALHFSGVGSIKYRIVKN